MNGLERCPNNPPGTHTWRYDYARRVVVCRDCGKTEPMPSKENNYGLDKP